MSQRHQKLWTKKMSSEYDKFPIIDSNMFIFTSLRFLYQLDSRNKVKQQLQTEEENKLLKDFKRHQKDSNLIQAQPQQVSIIPNSDKPQDIETDETPQIIGENYSY